MTSLCYLSRPVVAAAASSTSPSPLSLRKHQSQVRCAEGPVITGVVASSCEGGPSNEIARRPIQEPFRVAVLDDYQRVAEHMADWDQVYRCGGEVVFFHDHVDDWTRDWSEALAQRLIPFEVVVTMRERSRFPEELLRRLPNLRLICTQGAGNFSIDVEACERLGIVIAGTGQYGSLRAGSSATAELTWALLLGCARRLGTEQIAMRNGEFMTTVGMDVDGCVLGILGLGRLGSKVAKYGQAFGMRVMAWSESLTKERCAELGVELAASMEDLLRKADFVSIHLRQSSRTIGLIGLNELGMMKPSAVLINTSRGPIVDEDSLVAALARSPPAISGFAGDVFTIEPLPTDHALRHLDSHVAPGVPSVLLTPHIGYVTEDTYRSWFAQIVENITVWAKTGKPKRALANAGYSVHVPTGPYPKASKL